MYYVDEKATFNECRLTLQQFKGVNFFQLSIHQ